MKRSNRSKKNFIALKQKNFVDKIIILLMNSYWSNTGIYVKLMREVSKNWNNWRSFRVPPSTPSQEEDQSKIKRLSWNSLARYRNCKNEIDCMNDSRDFQDAESVHSGQSTSVFPTSSNSWRNARPFYRNAEPQRRAAKHLGLAWYIGKRFCKSSRVFCSTLSAGNESMDFRHIRTDSLINGGEEWESNTSSASEMPVRTVSQKFIYP